MEITRTENGFVQQLDHDTVSYVECDIHTGKCIVHYKNDTSCELHIGCSFYNSQYGVPVSEDGQVLFISDWDKDMKAYEISTGKFCGS